MAKARLKLVESKKQIEAKINRALKKQVDKVLIRSASRLIVPVRKLIKDALIQQPEVSSLRGGQLTGEFGLPRGSDDIMEIIDDWANSVKIVVKKATLRGGVFRAGMTIAAIEKDYEDALANPAASVVTKKGVILPWLEWLLRFGDRTIVRDFDVSFNAGRVNRSGSRSGLAVMVKREGTRWKVPAQYVGTANNNFVTRALDSVNDEIIALLQKDLRKF